MTILARVVRFVLPAAILFAGSAAVGSLSQHAQESHRSLLPATVTLTNGLNRAVTLTGVGCDTSMCSRVLIRNGKDEVWLDGLASVTNIVASNNTGPVKATFHFKNGKERATSIGAGSRVLYLQGPFGLIEKLDLRGVSQINF